MSLVVHLVLPGAEKESAKQIASHLAATTGLKVDLDPRAEIEGIKGPALAIADLDGSLANWIIADEPDLPHEEWASVRALLMAVREINRLVPTGFALQAKWISDKLKAERKVLISELIELIDRRELKENVRYEVDHTPSA